MQVKALKSFSGKLGFIRAGRGPFTLPDQYANDLIRNGLVEPWQHQPGRNAAIAEAPRTATGKGPTGAGDTPQNFSRPEDGQDEPQLSPRRGRHSRKTT